MAIVARGLAAIAAKAGTYPAYVKDFGRNLCAFASVVKTYVDSAVALINAKFVHTTDAAGLVPLLAVVDYDFSVHGTTSPVDLGVEIPDNAIIIEVVEEIITDFASTSGTTTVTATVNSQSIGAAVTADGSNAAIASVLPSGTPLKMSAADEVNLVLSVDDITAGAARYYIRYVQSV